MNEEKIDWSQYDEEPEENISWSKYDEVPKPESKSKVPAERTGFSGIAADAIEMLSNALKGGKRFIHEIPSNLEKMGADILENPVQGRLHVLGQLGSGALEAGKSTINMARDLSDYLGKKEIPILSDIHNAKIPFTDTKLMHALLPHIPEGLEELAGTQPNPEKGDELTRKLIPILAGGKATVSGIRKGYRWANQSELKEGLKELDKNIRDKAKELKLSKEETSALSDKLRAEYVTQHAEKLGDTNPISQYENQEVKRGKINELSPTAETPEIPKRITEPSIPESPEISNSTLTPNQIKNQAANSVEHATEVLSQSLAKNQNPKVIAREGGDIAHAKIMQDKKMATELYDEARNYYDTNNVKVNNTAEIKKTRDILNELNKQDELAPGYGSGTETQLSLTHHINALDNEAISARSIYDLAKSLDHKIENIRDRQFKSGSDPVEFSRLESLGDNYQAQANKLYKKLEDTGDADVRGKIKEANKIWSNYSAVKELPEGRELLYNKSVTPGFMGSILGARRGRPYLKSIVEGSPELQEKILAMSHGKASKHGELLKPDEMIKSYINALPDTTKGHLESLRQAKANQPRLNEESMSLKQYQKELAKTLNKHKAEISERNDVYKKDLAESMKSEAEIKRLDNQIKFHQKAEKEMAQRLKEEKSLGKDISALEEKHNKIKSQIEETRAKRARIIGMGLKATGVSTIMHKIGL